MEERVNAPHCEPTQAAGIPTSIDEVRRNLEAAGHYVTIDGRVTEQTTATLIPCPVSRLRRWRLEGKGPRFFQPAKTPWYYLGDVLDWIQGGESLR
ncbi:MAG: hypothetical protein DI584_01385 [Stenotrophomonas sp.]|nr:MAG: hypothetical protein DI584_01385 [Stenotrophomonas sp.]